MTKKSLRLLNRKPQKKRNDKVRHFYRNLYFSVLAINSGFFWLLGYLALSIKDAGWVWVREGSNMTKWEVSK
jgi:hypothetical protein